MSFKIRFNPASPISVSLAVVLALSTAGCGGHDDVPIVQPPANIPFALEKSSYTTGDVLKLNVVSAKASSAAIAFADGQRIALPLLPDGNLIAPVIPSALASQAAKVVITTDQGVFESNEIRVQPIAIATSQPGIATQIYLDATIANLTSSIDELVTISEDPQVPEAAELIQMRTALQDLRAAVLLAQAGTPVELTAPNAPNKLLLDLPQLAVIDQYVMSLLAANANLKLTSPQALNGNTHLLGSTVASPSTHSFTIGSLDCTTFQQGDDQAFCRNLSTQIASDYIINAAGIVGTVGAFASGSLLALSAIGVASAAPAAVIAVSTVGIVVIANMVAGAVQGASAYGTGTPQGTNVRDNITNLTQVARDLVLAQLAKLLPNGGSDLMKQVNALATNLVGNGVANLYAKYDNLITAKTKPVTSCAAQATSGGQGSFAHRYDFGVARALRLDYDAFSIPDQFSLFDGSGQLGGTGGLVSGAGSVSVNATSRFVTVKVNAPSSGTAWNYSITCAN